MRAPAGTRSSAARRDLEDGADDPARPGRSYVSPSSQPSLPSVQRRKASERAPQLRPGSGRPRAHVNLAQVGVLAPEAYGALRRLPPSSRPREITRRRRPTPSSRVDRRAHGPARVRRSGGGPAPKQRPPVPVALSVAGSEDCGHGGTLLGHGSRLRDRVCVVDRVDSGHRSAAARVLADEGARVVVTGRDTERRVGESRYRAASSASCATSPSRMDSGGARGEVRAAVGLDRLSRQQRGCGVPGGFEELSDSQWEEMWQLNVMSFASTIKATLPDMRDRRRGAIERLVDGGKAAVDVDAELHGHEGRRALALAADCRPVRGRRDPVQRRHAGS